MNNTPFDESVYRVSADTIEALALMFLVPDEEAPAEVATDRVVAAARFDGLFSGLLVISASGGLLAELAGNMLGLPEGSHVGFDTQHDALKELANVICGNLLPVLAGTEPVFHIDPPIVLADPVASQAGRDQHLVGHTRLFTDAGSAEVALFVDQPSLVGAPG